MKTKFYLTALALPLALAACSNEDDIALNTAQQGDTVTLKVERGAFGTDSRAAWEDNNDGTASFKWTTVASDKIGMALINPSDASKVVTNYEMSLIGWYNANGEGAAATYGQTAQDGTKYTTTQPTDGNEGAGVFEATGLSVMDGNYIVYHPYNQDFAKAGYLEVDFASALETATFSSQLATAGDNAFSYSLPTTIEKGGKVAAGFATKNLSALVKLQLKSFPVSETLKKVILLEDAANFDAASKGFLKSAHLNAQKILTQTGADVLESPVYTSMLCQEFTTAQSFTGDHAIYMVAGPRTAADKYSILFINEDNEASIWKASVKFESGKMANIKVTYNEEHPFETLIITEGSGLKTILETATTYDNKTVYVLGDITIDSDVTVQAKNVTVKPYAGDKCTSVTLDATAAGRKLISAATKVGEGIHFEVPFILNSENETTSASFFKNEFTFSSLTVNAPVIAFQNKPGVLTVGNLVNNSRMNVGTTGHTATLVTENATENNGTITVLAKSGFTAGATWNNKGAVTNNGEIINQWTVNNLGSIDNTNGKFVQKLNGKFIGQNDIAADKKGYYVIEVGSDAQFTAAVARTCTVVRVVGSDISKNAAKGAISQLVEITGTSSIKFADATAFNGGLQIVGDGTVATLAADTGKTGTAEFIGIDAASEEGATAPKLTIEKNTTIKAKSIVNNGTGSIEQGGGTDIPAIVLTLSSTGEGEWDNYPQVVNSL